MKFRREQRESSDIITQKRIGLVKACPTLRENVEQSMVSKHIVDIKEKKKNNFFSLLQDRKRSILQHDQDLISRQTA